MKELLLSQEELILIASLAKSEKLLYFSATYLTVEQVNNVIDDKDERVLKLICDKGLCKKGSNGYVFREDVMRIINACDNYTKQIDVVKQEDNIYKTCEVFLKSDDDIISIVFDKSSKEFSFYYDDKNDITVLIKRLELESYIEDIECKFNISMKVNKLGKLIKYYNNSDNKKIAKLCDSLKIEQELIGKCIESTVDNSDCVNLACKESACIGKTESNVIYKGGNGLYLVKSQKDNNFVTIVHDNVAEILKQMLDSRNALSNKPIISESTKKDTPIYIFLVMIFISMIVMLVGVYTPLKPGKTGVILTLMKTGGGAVFFALIVIFILFSNRKPDAKTKKDLVFACGISFLAIILFIYLSYNGIKALGEDTREITSSNYSVERSMVFLSRDRLLLKVNSGNETISIEVTKSMYKELRNSNKPIKVTYYPYINIVNDIQYLE